MQSTTAKGVRSGNRNSNQHHGFQHGAMAIPEGKRFTCTLCILAARKYKPQKVTYTLQINFHQALMFDRSLHRIWLGFLKWRAPRLYRHWCGLPYAAPLYRRPWWPHLCISQTSYILPILVFVTIDYVNV